MFKNRLKYYRVADMWLYINHKSHLQIQCQLWAEVGPSAGCFEQEREWGKREKKRDKRLNNREEIFHLVGHSKYGQV